MTTKLLNLCVFAVKLGILPLCSLIGSVNNVQQSEVLFLYASFVSAIVVFEFGLTNLVIKYAYVENNDFYFFNMMAKLYLSLGIIVCAIIWAIYFEFDHNLLFYALLATLGAAVNQYLFLRSIMLEGLTEHVEKVYAWRLINVTISATVAIVFIINGSIIGVFIQLFIQNFHALLFKLPEKKQRISRKGYIRENLDIVRLKECLSYILVWGTGFFYWQINNLVIYKASNLIEFKQFGQTNLLLNVAMVASMALLSADKKRIVWKHQNSHKTFKISSIVRNLKLYLCLSSFIFFITLVGIVSLTWLNVPILKPTLLLLLFLAYMTNCVCSIIAYYLRITVGDLTWKESLFFNFSYPLTIMAMVLLQLNEIQNLLLVQAIFSGLLLLSFFIRLKKLSKC